MRIALIASVLVLLATPGLSSPCKIANSIYRDAENKGFELVFGPRIPGVAVSSATATIRHTSDDLTYNFSVTQSNGYGSISLLSIDPDGQGIEFQNSFGINFSTKT